MCINADGVVVLVVQEQERQVRREMDYQDYSTLGSTGKTAYLMPEGLFRRDPMFLWEEDKYMGAVVIRSLRTASLVNA